MAAIFLGINMLTLHLRFVVRFQQTQQPVTISILLSECMYGIYHQYMLFNYLNGRHILLLIYDCLLIASLWQQPLTISILLSECMYGIYHQYMLFNYLKGRHILLLISDCLLIASLCHIGLFIDCLITALVKCWYELYRAWNNRFVWKYSNGL